MEGDPQDPPAFDPPAPQNYLPIGPGTTWQGAVAHALTMPSVQMAMADFEARGYVRHAARDTAAMVADSTVAFIAYDVPGINPMTGMAMIVVVTKLKQGLPATRVIGGVAQWDGAGHLAASQTEPRLEIVIGDMTKTDSANYSSRLNDTFTEWLACTVLWCVECFNGMPYYPPGAIACCVVGAIVCFFL